MSADRTVVFLDLSRFTALTDVHGDAAAVDIVDRFTTTVLDVLPVDARLVKTLGDGVLVETARPDTALNIAAEVSRRLHDRTSMPELTGGIATGPVIDRDSDIFGRTVNLAARLADLAPAGELRVTEVAARAAAERDWQVEPLGPTFVRGFHQELTLFRVLLCRPEGCLIDPVCGMRITPGPGTPRVRDVQFCSSTCASQYLDAPDRYRAGPR